MTTRESEHVNGSQRREESGVKFEPFSFSHIAQLAVAVTVALALMKLLRASRGSMQLAVAVLTNAGYVGPLAFMFFALLQYALFFILFTFSQYRRALKEAGKTTRWDGWAPYLFWLMLGVFASFATFILFFTGCVALVADYFIDKRFKKKARTTGEAVSPARYMKIRRTELVMALSFSLLPSLFNTIGSDKFWAASERVTATGDQKIHGYVLKQDEKWLILLQDEPRQLKYIPIDSVKSREMCRDPGFTRTLPQLVFGAKLAGGEDCG